MESDVGKQTKAVVVEEKPETTSERPRLLLTNDDGINSPGLRLLAERLHSLYEVVVAAPARDMSGSGTGIGRFDARRASTSSAPDGTESRPTPSKGHRDWPSWLVLWALSDEARPGGVGDQCRSEHRPLRSPLRHGRRSSNRADVRESWARGELVLLTPLAVVH